MNTITESPDTAQIDSFDANAIDPRNVFEGKILVVDDESTTVAMVRHKLQSSGFANVETCTDGFSAATLVKRTMPDLVLLDLSMPGISGLDVLKDIRENEATAFVPVVIVTAETDRSVRRDALDLGATDFLNKPIDESELTPRTKNILGVKMHQDALKRQNNMLEDAVRQRTAELEASRMDVIHCLARAAEYRDDDTGNHVIRVGRYARIICEELGFDAEQATTLEYAAQLHDVGKIGIPDSILMKPGRLTSDEFELMQKHCSHGKKILHRCPASEETTWKNHTELGSAILDVGASPVLELATKIALTHHEWWDGTGYPIGLAGEDIPLEGRITAVADVFDALSSRRCYKEPFPIDRCFNILEEESGKHFDPLVIDAFFKSRRRIVEVQMGYAD